MSEANFCNFKKFYINFIFNDISIRRNVRRRNVLSTNCPFDEMSVDEMSYRRNVFDEMSRRRNVRRRNVRYP